MKSTVPTNERALYEATLELHQKAEKHPFAIALSSGTLSDQEWVDWCAAMLQIYRVLDVYLPPYLQRSANLFQDLLEMLPIEPDFSACAEDVVDEIMSDPTNVTFIGGLAYTLTGASLRGGQTIRKAIEKRGHSCTHLTFSEETREKAEAWLDALRANGSCAEGAKLSFVASMDIMDEIYNRYHQEG